MTLRLRAAFSRFAMRLRHQIQIMTVRSCKSVLQSLQVALLLSKQVPQLRLSSKSASTALKMQYETQKQLLKKESLLVVE